VVLKAMNGSYTLEDTTPVDTAPQNGGSVTAVSYRLSVDVKIPMLGILKRKAEKVIIETALEELKRRVEV
jgi:hypothetical protein